MTTTTTWCGQSRSMVAARSKAGLIPCTGWCDCRRAFCRCAILLPRRDRRLWRDLPYPAANAYRHAGLRLSGWLDFCGRSAARRASLDPSASSASILFPSSAVSPWTSSRSMTDVPAREALRGAWVEVLGPRTTIDDLTDRAGTIGYELLTRLGRRVRAASISTTPSRRHSAPDSNGQRGPMAKQSRAVFVCQNCGATASRWSGRCTACGEWNTLVEEQASVAPPGTGLAKATRGRPVELVGLSGSSPEARELPTGIGELDRVTGSWSRPDRPSSSVASRASASRRFFCNSLRPWPIAAIAPSTARARRRSAEYGALEEVGCLRTIGLASVHRSRNILTSLGPMNRRAGASSIQSRLMRSDVIKEPPGRHFSQVRAGNAVELDPAIAKTTTARVAAGRSRHQGRQHRRPKRVLEHMVDTVIDFEGERGITTASCAREEPLRRRRGNRRLRDGGAAACEKSAIRRQLFLQVDRDACARGAADIRRNRRHAAGAGRNPGASWRLATGARRAGPWWAGTPAIVPCCSPCWRRAPALTCPA